MSAVEEIREAAALMRERADLPWVGDQWHAQGGYVRRTSRSRRIAFPAHAQGIVELHDEDDQRLTNAVLAEHIASWHPVVARAVADLLDTVAEHIGSHACEAYCELDGCDESKAATALARVYLGLSS